MRFLWVRNRWGIGQVGGPVPHRPYRGYATASSAVTNTPNDSGKLAKR